MSKNYEDYKPLNPQPPRKRKNVGLVFIKYAILLLLVMALALSALFFITSHESENGGNKAEVPTLNTDNNHNDPADTTDNTTIPPETEDDPEPVEPEVVYTNVEVDKSGINKGGLILVMNNHKVVYPTAEELVKLSSVKTKSYKISTNTMTAHKDIIDAMNKMLDDFAAATGHTDLILWTSYRDEARQKQVYDDYVKKYGEEAAKTAVAKPGESDHNTGLGIAIRVYRDGKSYQLHELEGYNWLEENCHKYGFVERYPDDKIATTGLDYSSSFYLRYVGVPHAEYMKKNNLCLEEYIVKLSNYVYGGAHIEVVTDDGKAYEIYFVSGETDGEKVNIPVPEGKEYTISGNNINGFIVTASK
jgi:D-alanyl-D-alanine carboxypeptidase